MKKNTSISMITSGHPVAAIIMLSVCLTSLCLIGCAGCGGVKETQIDKVTITSPAQKALTHDSIVHIKKLVKDDAKVQISKSGAQVIQNDSVYAIIFRNDDGDSVGYYDIWNNNPFDDLPFEKQKLNKVNQPLRYDLPDILINNFNDQLPEYQVDFIEGITSIGRIDIHVNTPSYLDINKYKNYIPVTYQMNFLQGFDEEFEVPGSYAIVKILDNKGNFFKTVNIQNFSGQQVAVTQDAKYLVYSTYSVEKDRGACAYVYDLEFDKNVFKKCTDIRRHIGMGLENESIIGFGFNDFLRERKSTIYWVNSKSHTIYHDSFPARFGNYKAEEFGLVKPMNGPPRDTILFSKMKLLNLNR